MITKFKDGSKTVQIFLKMTVKVIFVYSENRGQVPSKRIHFLLPKRRPHLGRVKVCMKIKKKRKKNREIRKTVSPIKMTG